MKTILNLFDFASTSSWGLLLARFALLVVLTALIVWLVALILLVVTKKKEHKVAFTNWFKYCVMWAIDVAIAALGVMAILTIRNNGLYYFDVRQFSFSLHCGYILMLPEILLLVGWVVVYWMVNKSVKKSI